MSPVIKFPTDWVKINENVEHGDHLRFLDVGEQDERGGWIFQVAIIKNGEIAEQKKFRLNKTNFEEVKKLYGDNSDSWKGKEMKVLKVKVRNPQLGQIVDGIGLFAPGEIGEVNK